MVTQTYPTIEELHHVPENGKAELVDGKLVVMSPTGGLPGYAGGEIFVSLRAYARRKRRGFAFPDNVDYIVNLPHRRSFSPDASYYLGEISGGAFLQGAPVFAVEVRSEGDYGSVAEAEMARKRADYFAAGALVVWDVDVLRTEEVHVYRKTAPGPMGAPPTIYRRGERAEAEPAVPGWRMPVNDLFP
jgi:Uma2 family endonuclease